MDATYSIADLRYLMSRLRDPQTCCPWDIKQTYQSITPHTIEEVYEVVDAIERGDIEHLSEELGDLLFQIIFYSQLGEEDNQFDFDAVVSGITAKLVRRHPHVFPDGTLQSARDSQTVATEAEIKSNWETIKKQERSSAGASGTLDDIPLALPALSRAFKLQKRAATRGFDWPQISGVLEEEIAELEQEIANGDAGAMEDEMGDLLFSCVNLARHLAINPEKSLARASDKFKRRFQAMEAAVGIDRFADLSLEEMEQQWKSAKCLEST